MNAEVGPVGKVILRPEQTPEPCARLSPSWRRAAIIEEALRAVRA
ncbi:hypothetical protein AB0N16_23225 [Streptomyces sp. NPDC051105]